MSDTQRVMITQTTLKVTIDDVDNTVKVRFRDPETIRVKFGEGVVGAALGMPAGGADIRYNHGPRPVGLALRAKRQGAIERQICGFR